MTENKETLVGAALNLSKSKNQELYRELISSASKLRKLYDDFRSATLNLKASFDNVRQREEETEVLRQKYYEMLTMKLYSEAERDSYFEMEQNSRDMKDMYIEESQKLVHKCSTYVAFSNHHSEQREEYILRMLAELDNFHAEYQNLRQEKDDYRRQCSQFENEAQSLNATITNLRAEMKSMKSAKDSLESKCDEYRKIEADLTSREMLLEREKKNLLLLIADMEKVNNNLNDSINQCKENSHKLESDLKDSEMEVSTLNLRVEDYCREIQRIKKITEDQRKNAGKLTKERDEFRRRTNKLNVEILENKDEIAKLRKQRDWHQEEMKKAKKEAKTIRDKCEKLKKERESMKEEYNKVFLERGLVGKEKDRLVSREYRSRKRNQELTEDHKHLSKQVEEISQKYRRADERARKDGSVKQELRDTIKRLHKEMEEERKRMIKVTRDVRIQTDPDLACENRDIAIQHAQIKMKQALRARDQTEKEKRQAKIIYDRVVVALDRKTQELGNFETRTNQLKIKCNEFEKQLKHNQGLLSFASQELKKEKERQKQKMTNSYTANRNIDLSYDIRHTQMKDSSTQTKTMTAILEQDAHVYNQVILELQKSISSFEQELNELRYEHSESILKSARLEKMMAQEKSENEVLRRKISHLEGKYFGERHYMKEVNGILAKNIKQDGARREILEDKSIPFVKNNVNENKGVNMVEESKNSYFQLLTPRNRGNDNLQYSNAK